MTDTYTDNQMSGTSESASTSEEPKGHAEKMAAIHDAAMSGGDVDQAIEDANKPTMPEGIPEKFWNAETGEVDYQAMAQAYTELESKFGQQPQGDAEGDTEEEEEEQTPLQLKLDSTLEEAKEAGIDVDSLTNSYFENGELTEDDYKALEEKGIDRNVVDTYIAGQEAQARVIEDAMFSTVGGEENYKVLINWAGQSLDDESRQAYDDIMTSGDTQEMMRAVQALAYAYQQYAGTDHQSVTNNAAPAPVADGRLFKSDAEFHRAQADKRYKTDPVYRQEVYDRLEASYNAGYLR